VTGIITQDGRCYEVGHEIGWGSYSEVHVAVRGDETVWAAKRLYVDGRVDDGSWPTTPA
jgi:hypothetical protein